MTNAAITTWEDPAQTPQERPGCSADAIEDWGRLTQRARKVAEENGWTKAETARRAGMPDGTFHQWYSGKYLGRLETQNDKIATWLAAVDEMQDIAATVPASPGFIMTRSARDMIDTLTYAQVMPDMVVITYSAGLGKTEACRQFAATRPNAYLATMSPHTKTVHGMLVELAAELDIVQHNPAKLTRAIGRRLTRTGGGTLLMVDEAQNLKDEAIDQLRHFVDIYGCGIALVGNEEIYSRFQRREDGPSYAQIKRRIGKRLKRAQARVEDIDAFITAWGVSDPECRKFLVGIGKKPGALGQIDKTMKLASMIAAGAEQNACRRASPRCLDEPRRGGRVMSSTAPISSELGLICELLAGCREDTGIVIPRTKADALMRRLHLLRQAFGRDGARARRPSHRQGEQCRRRRHRRSHHRFILRDGAGGKVVRPNFGGRR